MNLPLKPGFIVRSTPKGLPKGAAHIWTGTDTACRMWSTGGLQHSKRWDYYIAPPVRICTLCHPEKHGIEQPDLTVEQPSLFD